MLTTSFRTACAALFLVTQFGSGASAQVSEKRVALVIGNAAYKEAPLRNPVNDARAMAAQLRRVGFQVIARENARKSQMEAALAEFGEILNGGAVGLFFYAGHGMQVNGRNFLVPVDATIASEHRVRLETIDVDLVLDQMETAKSVVNLVVLDACRNNPFERRFRSAGSGLAQINAPQGTMIAYATAPGKVASDGDGANGLYTSSLLQHLATPGLPVEEVFKRVRIDVAKATSNGQTPWESSSLTGNFFFVEPAAPAPVIATPAPAADREALFWQLVSDSNEPTLLRYYLAQYPKGMFVPQAQAKIAALEQRRKDEEAQKARPQPESAPQITTTPKQAAAPPAAPPAPLPPAQQQASLPAPSRTDGSAETVSNDGVWTGKGGGWSMDIVVRDGRLSGKAISSDRPTGTGGSTSNYQVNGRIEEDGTVTGTLSTANTFHGISRLSGKFPFMAVEGIYGGRLLLQRKSGSAPE